MNVGRDSSRRICWIAAWTTPGGTNPAPYQELMLPDGPDNLRVKLAQRVAVHVCTPSGGFGWGRLVNPTVSTWVSQNRMLVFC